MKRNTFIKSKAKTPFEESVEDFALSDRFAVVGPRQRHSARQKARHQYISSQR